MRKATAKVRGRIRKDREESCRVSSYSAAKILLSSGNHKKCVVTFVFGKLDKRKFLRKQGQRRRPGVTLICASYSHKKSILIKPVKSGGTYLGINVQF